MIVLYFGPDNLIPLASILTAVAGFILIFWHRLVGVVRKLFGRNRRAEPADLPGPEDDAQG